MQSHLSRRARRSSLKLGPLLIAVLLVATLLPSPSASAAINGVSERQYQRDTDWFATWATMEQFQRFENQGGGAFWYLNWSDNGCSAPSGVGLNYKSEFHNACERHDFCYRNNASTALNRPWMKNQCDSTFYIDMSNHCSNKSGRVSRWYCRRARDAYYNLVSWYGRIN